MSANLGRQLLRELRRSSKKEARNSPLWKYVRSEMRSNGGEERLLKEYIQYLSSSTTYRDLLSLYQGKGERSVEETAKLVGLKLPKKTDFNS